LIPIAHRGIWTRPDEQNTELALRRSFEAGFGVETDLRDLGGQLVISHDPPGRDALPARRLFELHAEADRSLPLALNIKADGLQAMVAALVEEFSVTNYFVFDMSVPDTLGYFKRRLRAFGRQSEYEAESRLMEHVAGVWIDCFDDDWMTADVVESHRAAGREVCIVSPELHRRDHRNAWSAMRRWDTALTRSLMLCTDHPDEARAFFQ
jgi:hypothetical protein